MQVSTPQYRTSLIVSSYRFISGKTRDFKSHMLPQIERWNALFNAGGWCTSNLNLVCDLRVHSLKNSLKLMLSLLNFISLCMLPRIDVTKTSTYNYITLLSWNLMKLTTSRLLFLQYLNNETKETKVYKYKSVLK